jgi:hypothetical protein
MVVCRMISADTSWHVSFIPQGDGSLRPDFAACMPGQL